MKVQIRLIVCAALILSMPLFARDAAAVFPLSAPIADAMQAASDDFTTGNYTIKESGTRWFVFERAIDSSPRGYDRVRVDFSEAENASTVASIQAWTGVRTSITIGAKGAWSLDKIRDRLGDRLSNIERRLQSKLKDAGTKQ